MPVGAFGLVGPKFFTQTSRGCSFGNGLSSPVVVSRKERLTGRFPGVCFLGRNPDRNRPVLLSHETMYHIAIHGSQKEDGSTPSPRARHRLRPGEHERSGPHLTDRYSQETRLRQGSHLRRQGFRGSRPEKGAGTRSIPMTRWFRWPKQCTRTSRCRSETSARRCVSLAQHFTAGSPPNSSKPPLRSGLSL